MSTVSERKQHNHRSTNGKLLLPYIVYKSEHLYTLWTSNGPSRARYNRSKTAWFNKMILEDWFTSLALFNNFKKFPLDRNMVLKRITSQNSKKNLLESNAEMMNNAFKIALQNLYNNESQPKRIQRKKVRKVPGQSVENIGIVEETGRNTENVAPEVNENIPDDLADLPSSSKSKEKTYYSDSTSEDFDQFSVRDLLDDPEDFLEGVETPRQLGRFKD
ncbi:hypothetical protein ILUMI_17019 [Ignelater luminosus]|uniref:Uncharacterized protein n=1 Tax=Ignelater luminosus TaxID=2038154 RepID=A0A8K0G7N7_IGNLU|nr:hypothetical protein ILUMI_17019 [Ignelater luminosus]